MTMKLAILSLIALISTATVSAKLNLTQPSHNLQRSDGLRHLSPISSSYPPRLLAQSASPQCWLKRAPNLPNFEPNTFTRYCFPKSILSECKTCKVLTCIPPECGFWGEITRTCWRLRCRASQHSYRHKLIPGCFKNYPQAVSETASFFCRHLEAPPPWSRCSSCPHPLTHTMHPIFIFFYLILTLRVAFQPCRSSS